VWLRLAEALTLAGHGEEARGLLVEAVVRFPESATVVAMFARTLCESGDVEAAEGVVTKWAAGREDDGAAQAVLGLSLLSSGRAREAAEVFRKRLAADPNDAVAVQGLAGALGAAGAPEEAEKALREVRRRAEQTEIVDLFLARVLLSRDPKSEEGLTLLGALISSPSASAALRGMATASLLTAKSVAGEPEAVIEEGERFATWVEGQDLFDRGRPLAPMAARVFHLVALAHDGSGTPRLAERSYRESLAREPKNAVALNNLSVLLSRSIRTADEAESLAREALELAPGVPEFVDTLGLALAARGNHAGAIATFTKALDGFRARLDGPAAERARRDVAETWLNIARSHATAGDRPAARAAVRSAREADPGIVTSEDYRRLAERVQ
jgi:tetratricopeptide (TPR) repeat protein